jgi:hypothetical protein
LVPRTLLVASLLTFALVLALPGPIAADSDRSYRSESFAAAPAGAFESQPATALGQTADWARAANSGLGADLTSSPEPKSDLPLSNSALSELLEATAAGFPGPHPGLNFRGSSVSVEVLHSTSSERIREVVASAGGHVYGEIPGHLVEASVPVDRLVELEAAAEVELLRPPLAASVPIGSEGPPEGSVKPAGAAFVGEEIFKMNVQPWHDAGFTGQGVRIGIIDSFDGPLWDAAQAAGELPEPSGTLCIIFGNPCDVFNQFQSQHGEGVAEIIHEMAPDAQLYLASAYTPTDVQAVVDYFQSQGVQILSRSETSEYDGPGDGTGPLASVVNNAISQGMVWLNSAGNSSGDGDMWPGGYWRDTWFDSDANNFMDFGGGTTELLGFECGFINGLRWSDWGSPNPTDFDIFVYDDPQGQMLKATSEDEQGPTGTRPLELLHDGVYNCDPNLDFDIDFLAIKLFAANDGSGDTLEFMTNTSINPALTSNPHSASGPFVDSSNPGMLAVGAIDPALGTLIAGYSSWGPTNDGRGKPDVSGAACMESFTYAPGCFNGTSSATPAVAGVTALVLSAALSGATPQGGLVGDPAGLANYIRGSTVDRGAPGQDNIYGRGEVILGDPPDGSGGELVWGDVNCQGGANPVDSLAILRHDAGHHVNTNGCPDLGDAVVVQPAGQPPNWIWGDIDCSLAIDAIDGLKLLRFDAGLSVSTNHPDCPNIGDELEETGGPTPTHTPVSSATPTRTPTASPTTPSSPTNTPTPTPAVTGSPTPTPSPSGFPLPSNDCDDLPQPISIPDNNSQNPALLFVEIPDTGDILELLVCINIDHPYVGDLRVGIEHVDTGTSTIIMDVDSTCDGSNVRVLLSDDALTFADDVCNPVPPAINGTYRPTNPLSVFEGEPLAGTWIIAVFDLGAGDIGSVEGATMWWLVEP